MISLVYILPFHVAHHYTNTSQTVLICLRPGCWGKEQHHNRELQPGGGKWFSQFHMQRQCHAGETRSFVLPGAVYPTQLYKGTVTSTNSLLCSRFFFPHHWRQRCPPAAVLARPSLTTCLLPRHGAADPDSLCVPRILANVVGIWWEKTHHKVGWPAHPALWNWLVPKLCYIIKSL